MELSEILGRIEQRLKTVNLSAAAASKKAGKTDAIRNIQRAVENNDRKGVSTATLNALAPVLGTTPIWLLAGAGPEAVGGSTTSSGAGPQSGGGPEISGLKSVPAPRAKPARYAGLVEAGSFRAVEDFDDDDPGREPLWTIADREFPELPLVYFVAVGDSMNAIKDDRAIVAGDQLICLDFEDLRGALPIRDGLIVVVEQTLDGGHHRERSVKQVELYEDRIEFWPRSTNKKHKPIVVPKVLHGDPSEDDGKQVRILAVVRGVFNDMTRL